MNKKSLVRAFLPLALCPLLGAGIPASAGTGGAGQHASTGSAASAVPAASVPKAHCGPGDRTESGLQGQTTTQERVGGDSQPRYKCHPELVGQYTGEGAFSQDGPAYAGDCAYYGTDRNTSQQQHHGVTVVDAADPRHPKVTAYLDDTPAALVPHETVQTNTRRHLLVVAQ